MFIRKTLMLLVAMLALAATSYQPVVNAAEAINSTKSVNWVFVGKDTTFDFYIDANSIEKNGNSIVYWGLWDARELNQSTKVKKWVCKREVAGESNWQLHPQELHQYGVGVRQLEIYQYDENNQEIFRSTTPEGWRVANSEEIWGQEISLVLKYAK